MLGVAAFSLTVPCTAVAVADGGLSPLFVAAARAVVATLLAATALAFTRQRLPRGRRWARLAVVAAGVVAGFPLLTTYALTSTSAGHSAVVIALLPAATAVVAALRAHERPGGLFWATAATGAIAAVGFAAFRGDGFGAPHSSDFLLIGAVLAAAFGYAEGGLLSRELGSWQTISWALVLAAPVMLALTAFSAFRQPPSATPAQWAAFAYLGVVSMFLGFLAWYRGLAHGPMAQVSQIQLVQPVLTLCWAALLLRETLTWPMILVAVAVIGCAGSAVRTRLGREGSMPPPSVNPASPQETAAGTARDRCAPRPGTPRSTEHAGGIR